MTESATETPPSTTTISSVARSGRRRATSFRSVPLKSFERSTGTERPMNPPPPIGRRLAKPAAPPAPPGRRSEEHTSELQSQSNLVCRLLLEKKKIQEI